MKMTNRQLAALETKKKLLEAGKWLICEKGLADTSVEEITQTCGVSKGTFYTYFKRKEDIALELSRDMFHEILENAKVQEGDFLKKLTHYMVNFSGYIEQAGVKLSQEWVKSVVNPNLVTNDTDKGKLQSDLSSVRQLIEFGREQKLLRDELPVAALTHGLVDLLYGQMLCWNMSDGAYSLKERTQEFCNTCLEAVFNEWINRNI